MPYECWKLWIVADDDTAPMAERDAAAAQLIKKAQDGDPHAQYLTGKLYQDGPVLIPDSVEALYWFEQAVKQGHSAAQYAAGKILLSPDSEVHNPELGIQWLESAAQNKNGCAAYQLGKEYLKGKIVPKDTARAMDYLIRVQRQILRQNGAVVEAPLKTKNSYRNIAIGTDTVELLRQMNRRSTSEYVFPSPTGGPISPDSVLHMLQRVLKRAGLEKIPFHALRHTFSVLALQNGVDVKTLSSMLGHYSAGFTLDTYAHVTTTMQTKAANTVSSFLSGAIQ